MASNWITRQCEGLLQKSTYMVDEIEYIGAPDTLA